MNSDQETLLAAVIAIEAHLQAIRIRLHNLHVLLFWWALLSSCVVGIILGLLIRWGWALDHLLTH